jgi:Uma2 family endonuclease
MGTIKIDELPHYTYEDYLLWQGDWELINGIPYAMTPAPTVEHQRISQRIAACLGEALEECNRCHALLPVDWKISEDTVLQPDNLVVCYEPKGTHIVRAPSLIFEILSRSSAHKDQKTKYELYEQEGVNYYVMVDPTDRVAKIYGLVSGKYKKLIDTEDEIVTFDLESCSIELDFARIFK